MLKLHHLLVVGAGAALVAVAIATRGRLPWRSPLVLAPAALLVVGLLAWTRAKRR